MDSGHFIMEDQPELLDKVIAEFIAGRPIQPVYKPD